MLPLWLTFHVQGLAYAYAIWNGDAEERLIGWVEAGVLALDIVLLDTHVGNISVELLSVIIDVGIALSVALRSNKTWPLAYSAVALATLLTVVAQLVAPVSHWAYVTTLFVWIYLECLVLVVGAWRAGRARRAISIGGAPLAMANSHAA
ncbi:hypothetical protein LJR225_002663 [Phenylobacterium sp. LjRoot225]|uniref:hypothetical protein n=1 Tax=Phenylobacterium sp. LjRoot225 TaxID=3342285 RepID=UPI003ED0A26C